MESPRDSAQKREGGFESTLSSPDDRYDAVANTTATYVPFDRNRVADLVAKCNDFTRDSGFFLGLSPSPCCLSYQVNLNTHFQPQDCHGVGFSLRETAPISRATRRIDCGYQDKVQVRWGQDKSNVNRVNTGLKVREGFYS